MILRFVDLLWADPDHVGQRLLLAGTLHHVEVGVLVIIIMIIIM